MWTAPRRSVAGSDAARPVVEWLPGTAPSRRGRRGGGWSGAGPRLFGGGDVEAQLDLVGHEHVARAEHLVELHVEVGAVELAGDLQADALVAPRIDLGALDLGLERDLARDAVNRQVADDLEAVLVERADRGRAERDLREALDVEEVAGAQVLVALGLVGVDRGGLDG